MDLRWRSTEFGEALSTRGARQVAAWLLSKAQFENAIEDSHDLST
jgi:hypothetical protein